MERVFLGQAATGQESGPFCRMYIMLEEGPRMYMLLSLPNE